MNIKRALVSATVAGGVAIAGAGLGAGSASATTPTTTVTATVATPASYQQQNHNQPDPNNQNRGDQNRDNQNHGNQNRPPAGWQPGPVQRPDHNSFNYWGQQVTPQWQPQYHQWGFWFFGFWIPVNI